MARSKTRKGMDIMPDGRRRKRFTFDKKRYTVYGHTEKETEEKAIKLRMELEAGAYRKNSAITLDGYFKEWENQREGKVSEKTIFEDGNRYKNHVKGTTLGKKRIQKIERREIVELQNKIAKTGSINMANRIVMLIYHILADAIRDEIISKNPAEHIEFIKDTKAKAADTIHRYLTKEELKIFLDAAQGNWYYIAFRLMLGTGIRSGELGALEWGDIDYKNGVIHIRRTLTADKTGKIIIGQGTKTKTSHRDIPMGEEVKAILQEHKAFYDTFHDNIQGIHSRVFESPRGVFGYKQMNVEIKKILRKLNKVGYHIAPFSCHAFRSTFATELMAHTRDPKIFQSLLGHTSPMTGLKYYAHAKEEENRKAMEGLRVCPMVK